jgi:Ca2+-binding RTX toxin-like protein
MKTRRCALLAVAVAGVSLGVATERANAAYSVNVQNNVLTVTGDGASDALALRLAPGSQNTILIDVGDDGTADFATDRNLYTQIVVNAGGGSDAVRIDQTNGDFTGAEATTLNGQAGDDTLIGGNGSEIFLGGDNNDTVRGGAGNDVVLLGTGNDTFVWKPGDGNDTLEGGTGADLLDFDGSSAGENLTLSANGTRLLFFRDIAAVTLDTNDVERVGVHPIGGADTVTVNPLGATDVTRVDVSLEGTIGGGAADGVADTVTVNGDAGVNQMTVAPSSNDAHVTGPSSVFVLHADQAGDTLNVDPLAGNDRVTLFGGVSSLLQVLIDGGADSDTVVPTGTGGADEIRTNVLASPAVDVSLDAGVSWARVLAETIDIAALGGPDTIVGSSGIALTGTAIILEGGPGADHITGSDAADLILGNDGDDTVTGGRGSDVALLGAGNDTFVWNPGDASDVVEGQSGTDLLAFNGSNVNENISLTPNGARLQLFRDVAAVTMDANDVEQVDVHALGGTDNVTVDPLAGTSVTRVEVDLAAFGGGGDGLADTVTVNGTASADSIAVDQLSGEARVVDGPTTVSVAHSEPANDQLRIMPLAGNDQVTFFPGVTSLLKLKIDGGSDSDTVIPTGTSGPDSFQVAAPAPPTVNVFDGGVTAEVLSETIDVRTLAGNDSVIGGNGLVAAATHLVVEGGANDDLIVGSDGSDTILGETGNDTIRGGRGDDVALMGAGNDTFVWNPGDGNDTVEGQDGADVLSFTGANISENINLSANGGRLRLFRDVANIVMDTDGVERVDLNALGGTDTITVNPLNATDVIRVDADLAAFGGGGDGLADRVIVNGTTGADIVGITPIGGDVRVSGLTTVFVSGSEPGVDKVEVNTLDGNDQVTGTVGLAARLLLKVDAGIGADTMQGGDGNDDLVGGDGNDSIRGNDGNDSLSGGPGTDFLNGGAGADQFFCGGAGDTLVTDPSDAISNDCL